MYRAKSSGGGQHRLFDSDLATEHQAEDRHRESADRSRSAGRLRARFPAPDESGDRRGRRRGGAATLEPPARRPAPAGDFHSVAERTGLIADIGDWVVDEVATYSAAWHRDGFDGRLSFNVSPRQVDRPEFFVASAVLRRRRRALSHDRARVHRECGNGSRPRCPRGDCGAARGRRKDRDRRFRHRLLQRRPASLDAARPG